MKRCPKCAEIYADETLRFCRTDGALLTVFDTEAPTTEFGSAAATAAKTVRETPRRRPSKSKAIDSIAILPFDNASADSHAEYLSDGITENIINNLSQLPRLKVMARSTVFRYKGERVDPQRVADELGVRAVVTGRVQQLGDRLKIGIELVDAADGSQLWGERYVRQMADVFELQDEISEQISTRLKLTLTSSRRKRPVKRHTKRREVYDLYLRGRFFWNKRTEADAHRGIECFRQALAIDPSFAMAYGGLADCQTLLGDVGLQATPPKEAFLQGQESAARALALDDSLAEAHGTMGHLSMHLFDWPRAESELLSALELSPNYAQAWVWYAYYLAFTGKPDESIQTIKRALEVDPLSLPANTSAGELLHFAQRREESIEQYQKALELNPQHTIAHLGLGRVYERARMVAEAFASFGKARELSHDSPESLASVAHCHSASGQSDEARALLTKLNELKKMRYVSSYDLALVHAGLGESDEAFKWLNRGCEIHDGWMIYITVDPRWEQLRPDDRFRGVVGRVGLSV